MTGPGRKVLIVEDQFLVVEYLRILLEGLGHEICASAATADEAVKEADKHHPDVVLMDYRLEGPRDGVDAAIEIARRMSTEIIFLTGSSDPTALRRMADFAPRAVLFKPVDPVKLARALVV